MTAVYESTDTAAGSEPNDRDAERIVLGCMLQSEWASADAADAVRAVDFYDVRHAEVFRVLLDLYGQGKAGDWMLAADEMHRRGVLARLDGGAAYLHSCIAAVPTVANVGHYAKIVRRLAKDRRMIVAGRRIVAIGYTSIDEGVSAKDDLANLALAEAIEEPGTGGLTRIGDRVDDVLAAIERGAQQGYSTGFSDLDAFTYGLRPGLWVIGGRPGMGKSTFLVDIARYVAIHLGKPAALFSMEMTESEVITRILSAESRVPLHVLKRGGDSLSEADWIRLHAASERLKSAPLLIDDTSDMSVSDIAARTRRMAAGDGLAFLGIDYLQLLRGTGRKNENREREVATISRGLKVLSKDLKLTVAVAAQLNRGPEQRNDKRPQLSDLRESGALEADADVAILMHRPDYYDKESERAGEADVILAKNRDGATDTVTVAAQLHIARFVSMEVG